MPYNHLPIILLQLPLNHQLFLEEFYQGIRLDDDLYKAIMMDLEQEDIKISQEGFQKVNIFL